MSNEYKQVKFPHEHVDLILSGKKTSTWRYEDNKNIVKGDILQLVVLPEMKVFARVEVVSAVEKPIGSFTKKDKEGHEVFASDKEMYTVYSGYAGTQITGESVLKIIRFKILDEYE